MEALAHEEAEAETARNRAVATVEGTVRELTQAEAALAEAAQGAERAGHLELETGAQEDDAKRAAAHARREARDATTQVDRLTHRLGEVETRLAAVHDALHGRELQRVRLDERLGAGRRQPAAPRAQQEAARGPAGE